MANIIKLGNNSNSQKMVFTMLAMVLLLEFGSLTKLQKIWHLAFTNSSTTATTQQQTATLQMHPNTHPTTTTTPQVGMPV